jgi:hypothetical protein
MDTEDQKDREIAAAFSRVKRLEKLVPGSPEANRETISALKTFKGSCYRRRGWWFISWVTLPWMSWSAPFARLRSGEGVCTTRRLFRRFKHEETARRWLAKIVLGLAVAEAARKYVTFFPDPIDETVAELNAKRSPDAPRATRTEAAYHILRQRLDLDDGEPAPTPPKAAPARN